MSLSADAALVVGSHNGLDGTGHAAAEFSFVFSKYQKRTLDLAQLRSVTLHFWRRSDAFGSCGFPPRPLQST